MSSVVTAFIDGTLPVDPSPDDGSKKDLETLTDNNIECKSKVALNSNDQLPDLQEITASEKGISIKNETRSENQTNSCNESGISQDSSSKACKETFQNTTKLTAEEKDKSFLNTCIDNPESSLDVSQNKVIIAYNRF